MIHIDAVRQAKKSFRNFIKTTPLEYSHRLSKEYGANIYLKREDMQMVRSYKIRWAFNLIHSLSEEEKQRWVVCASAGNHAQWVALTCRELKIHGTIFMPVTTPEQKVYKTKQFGWEYIQVVLVWDSFDEALASAKVFEHEKKAVFVHPFDDERIITGQATIGLEIIEQFDGDIDYVITPIGWGWLIGGLLSVFAGLSTGTRVIWVEPVWSASMQHSLSVWENRSLHKIDTFVDGAAVKKVGDIGFEIAKNYWLEVFLSPEDRVCSTMLECLKEEWVVIEPAWALSIDILKDEEIKKRIKGKNIVLILSGSNFDFDRLPEIKERSLRYEGLKKHIIVSFPQRPGALKEFLNFLWEHDDMTRFEYLKKSNKDRAPALVWLQTNVPENFIVLFERLKKAWVHFEDITNNSIYFDLLI